MSSSSINESGREFHNLIVEGRKEFKYVSVLAKGVTKRWLCPVTLPMVPPQSVPPGPSAAIMDGPPGPCTAATLGPGGTIYDT